MEEFEYYGFIYITTNKINGKRYIGKKKYDLGYESYLGSGVALKNAILKYGRENFSTKIIDNAKTLEELNEKEINYIKLFNACLSPSWYNISSGGDGGWTMKGYSEEKKKIYSLKMSKSLKGRVSPTKGMKVSEETRKKISTAHKGRKNSKDHIKNIKKNHARHWEGKKFSEETKEKIRNNSSKYWKGKSLPEETRKKISDSVKLVTHKCFCKTCLSEFEGKSSNAYTCSDCKSKREDEKKKRLTRNCDTCNKEFSTYGKLPWNRKTCWECKP